LNWASDVPLVVKNVPAVPSGPTKLKGPPALLLAAAWNLKFVLAGTVAFHASVVQLGVLPTAGLASFSPETRSPDTAKPESMYVLKPTSVVCPVQVAPLLVDVTRRPFA
jgi:hypothetical protein